MLFFLSSKNRITPIYTYVLLWVLTLLKTFPSSAQSISNYQTGDYRTSSTGVISQESGTATLEQRTSEGNWIPTSYPLPSSATLYIEHTITITGSLEVASLIVAPAQHFSVSSGSTLKTSSTLIVSTNADAAMIGSIEISGNLQLLASSKLYIKSPTYDASSPLWTGTETIDATSELIIENATSNALLFDQSKFKAQAHGYWFGKLTIKNPSSNTQWQLVNGEAPIAAQSTTVTTPSSSSILFTTTPHTNLRFGQDLNLNGGTAILQNQMADTLRFSIEGSLNLQSTSLTLNQAANSLAVTLLNLKGNLQLDANSFINNSIYESSNYSGLQLTGTTWQDINVLGSINHVSINIKTGALARLKNSLKINPNNSVYAGTLTIENGGSFDFGTDNNGEGYTVQGQGYFKLNQGGTIYITSQQGISASGATGNIQVTDTRRTINQLATFIYSGKLAQQTGSAITTATNGKIIIIDNPTSVMLTQSTGISSATTINTGGGRLEIKQGEFITTPTAAVSSSGKLVMYGGVYKIAALNTTVPQLTGAYTLTGGTIELNGTGNQTLRGGTSYKYYNVLVSGSNVQGSTSKTISTTTTINQSITILQDAILDVGNKALSGAGGLIMSGGLLRLGKSNVTLPELSGTTVPYSLTGGTIEFYGTSSGQYQSIRGGITYYNLELNATQPNLASDKGNILPSANFNIVGNLTVNAPTVLQIAYNRAIGGSGNFTLNPGATLLYGSPQGIKISGTGTSDGNIRVSGSRTYSTQANYGFIGTSEMVSGNGLPSTVAKLLVAKSSNGVTLSQSVSVSDTLTLQSGLLKTGSFEIGLANPAPEALKMADETLYIQGYLRRAVANAGVYNFPIGTSTGKHWLEISSNDLSGNGFNSLLVSFQPLANHNNSDLQVKEGTNLYNRIAPEGVWFVEPNATPASGSYTVKASLTGFSNLEDNKFAPLIRPINSVSGKDWTTGGGTIDAANKEGRTVISGFSKRNFAAQFGQIGIGSFEESVLPVTWLYVQAQSKNQHVEIKWATSTEMNNDHFEIESSLDGIAYSFIAQVKGSGNSNVVQQYQYRHSYPATGKTIYYRIKQVDLDGKFEYSKLVPVSPIQTAPVQLAVYPNPTQEQLSVSGLTIDENTSLEIINLQGKTVERVVPYKTDMSPRITVKHLPAGNYFLKVKQADALQQIRFVKQ